MLFRLRRRTEGMANACPFRVILSVALLAQAWAWRLPSAVAG